MELKLSAVRGAAWLPGCLSIASRAGCAALAAGSLLCLAIAGAHYAVSSGLLVPSEVQGTRVVIAYSLCLSVALGATSLAGSVPSSPRARAAALGAGATISAAIVVMCEASSCFGATDCAFGLDFLRGVNVVLGAACAIAASVGAGLWALLAPEIQEEEPLDEGADGDSGDLAAGDGGSPAEEVAEDAPAELAAEASDDDGDPAEDDPADDDGAAGSPSELPDPAALEEDEEA